MAFIPAIVAGVLSAVPAAAATGLGSLATGLGSATGIGALGSAGSALTGLGTTIGSAGSALGGALGAGATANSIAGGLGSGLGNIIAPIAEGAGGFIGGEGLGSLVQGVGEGAYGALGEIGLAEPLANVAQTGASSLADSLAPHLGNVAQTGVDLAGNAVYGPQQPMLGEFGQNILSGLDKFSGNVVDPSRIAPQESANALQRINNMKRVYDSAVHEDDLGPRPGGDFSGGARMGPPESIRHIPSFTADPSILYSPEELKNAGVQWSNTSVTDRVVPFGERDLDRRLRELKRRRL